ncbi:MAG: hypothetical protein QXS37_00755 [Candidatus Aenigmatarchaeota archaeon]
MGQNKMQDVSAIVNFLKNWYKKFGRRELWWRRTKLTPYKVFVIETFLWKTRVNSVKNAAREFLLEFPDINSLAKSSPKYLESKFSNLGLQKRRSTLLVKAANYIVQRCGGEFPKTYEELVRIPGVGQYLANAILCFGFGQPTIPVDVNVKKALENLFGTRIKNIRKIDGDVKKILKKIGEAWGDFKEAAWCLIDFGSHLSLSKDGRSKINKTIRDR